MKKRSSFPVEQDEAALQAMTARWQRVLKAYLALRAVRSLRSDEPHTPALARLVAFEEELRRGDLEVRK